MTMHLRPAVVLLIALSVLTGLIYPAVVTGIAQVAFSRQANGSLIVRDGKVVGSMLIGQPFDDPKYFWGRPSATSRPRTSAASSSGSNQGPTNPALTTPPRPVEALRPRPDTSRWCRRPVDGLGSGLAPTQPGLGVSQVPRVARFRRLDGDAVRCSSSGNRAASSRPGDPA